jgi:cytochrome c biogenesis protein CcmG/thiol:disulfide interchange protein DsbE
MNRLKLFVPLLIFIGMAIVFYRGFGVDSKALPQLSIGKPMPQFSLLTLEGVEANREILGNEGPYLLNVWATWCAPCVQEHPYLVNLSKQGVRIAGLNYKDDNQKAIAWLKRLGDPYYIVVADPVGKLALDLGITGFPETYLVDENGSILVHHVGMVNSKVWQEKLKQPYEKAVEAYLVGVSGN